MATATPQIAPPGHQAPREVIIFGHSTLFYWWPVWAVGYLMALISLPWFTGERVVLVPEKSEYLKAASGSITAEVSKSAGVTEKKTVDFDNRDVLLAPKADKRPLSIHVTPVHISTSKNLGVFFTLILLVVIVITNVPLRGLWSVIVIILIVSLVIILGLLGILDKILDFLSILDIRITTGGYVVISTVLLALWLVIFFAFDHQIYMVFAPGQLRVKLEIGDAETVFPTTAGNVTFQKRRSDLFRHWILGLGSGDLIVHVGRAIGEHGQDIPMANVLFIGRRVHEIEDMLRLQQVVQGPSA
jgi:hypothetical protein